MKPANLLVLFISLPLLLGGCGGEKEVVNFDLIEKREGIRYLKDSDTPYTGKAFTLYKNGKKESNQNYKDGKLHGLFISWRDNGKKWSEGNYKDGKEDGLWVWWYENGQKEMEGNYKDSKQDRLWVYWHKNGQKREAINFKDGKEISAKYWNSKGEEVSTLREARK